jgi:GTP-binding protein
MLQATKHLLTTTDGLRLEQGDAEVCLAGRSNAGKSSLINALCQKKRIAHVSQTPGKTRVINVYEVKPYRWIVDLPGYGFALGPRAESVLFGPMIETYLASRQNLRMILLVLDAVAGPTKLDLMMVDWLNHKRYPFRIIVNKIDKIGPSKLEARKKEIAGLLSIDAVELFWISAKNTLAIEPLRQMIAQLLKV